MSDRRGSCRCRPARRLCEAVVEQPAPGRACRSALPWSAACSPPPGSPCCSSPPSSRRWNGCGASRPPMRRPHLPSRRPNLMPSKGFDLRSPAPQVSRSTSARGIRGLSSPQVPDRSKKKAVPYVSPGEPVRVAAKQRGPTGRSPPASRQAGHRAKQKSIQKETATSRRRQYVTSFSTKYHLVSGSHGRLYLSTFIM